MLEVRISDSSTRPGAPVLQSKVDLGSVLEKNVYVGFTAATGSCNEKHEIKSLYFHNDFIKNGITIPTKPTPAGQKKE